MLSSSYSVLTFEVLDLMAIYFFNLGLSVSVNVFVKAGNTHAGHLW